MHGTHGRGQEPTAPTAPTARQPPPQRPTAASAAPRPRPATPGPPGPLTQAQLADVGVVGPEDDEGDDEDGQPGERPLAAPQPPRQSHLSPQPRPASGIGWAGLRGGAGPGAALGARLSGLAGGGGVGRGAALRRPLAGRARAAWVSAGGAISGAALIALISVHLRCPDRGTHPRTRVLSCRCYRCPTESLFSRGSGPAAV